VAAVSALTAELLKNLGYSPTSVNLSLPIIFASLQNNNIDVFLGNWMPAQESDLKPYRTNGSIEVVGPNLEGAKFTLAVPKYLYDAGLRDFESIARFGPELHNSIYGIEPGAAANRLVLGMIKDDGYGLGTFKLIESSEQGMLAELDRANRSHNPMVFVGWAPHPMNIRFPIEYLAGGDRVFGPNLGGATINTVTRSGFSALCPNVGRLLRNLRFTVKAESELMAAMLDEHVAPEQAARAWLRKNPDSVRRWLKNVSRAGALSGKAVTTSVEVGPGTDVGPGTAEDWILGHKIPLGDAATTGVEFLKSHYAGLFTRVSAVINTVVETATKWLRAVPAPFFIIVVSLASGLTRQSWRLALFVAAALLYILNQGYWTPMFETLALMLVATLLSVAIGIPIGIAAAHHRRFDAALRPVLDLMQTLPTFVYLIPTLVLFGLGPVPGLISTVIFAMPAPIRMTREGIVAVPVEYKDVAHALGATKVQVLWKVELPSARQMIFAGITQCIMLSLSMVVIAALVGAGGLGVPVVRALGSVQVAQGFEAGSVIVLLAIVIDRICANRT
jgi:glycine betaine/proline transport system substrate-binding protein